MLNLPDHAALDKLALVGGCSRLQIQCDAARLQAEVRALPEARWGTRGGRVGVHNAAQAIFLRGYAPAEGDLPIEDRETLALTPYVREIITRQIPAPPMRCLLALLPPGAVVKPHVDQFDYFNKTIRIHLPVVTSPQVWMYCGDASYRMVPGEIWALNNCTVHAVWNADPEVSRIHLICDFLPTPELLSLLAKAERGLGVVEASVRQRLFPARAAAP